METRNKPIRLFHEVIGYVDHGDKGMQVRILGYEGKKDLMATTSLVVGPLHRNDKQEVTGFETLNSRYIRVNQGSATP